MNALAPFPPLAVPRRPPSSHRSVTAPPAPAGTAATDLPPVGAARPTPLERAADVWLAGGCLMFAGLAAVVPASVVDPRTLDGVGVWDKPMKFWVSIGLHFLTLALLARLVEAGRRVGAALLVIAWASVGCGIVENAYVTAQAARGRASHFNYATPYEAGMYYAMGVGALVLVLASLALAVALLRRPPNERRWTGLRLGAVLGLALGSVLTVAIAGFIGVHGSHYVGATGSDAGGVPLVGWSTALADLRPAHFAATHLMQALPLAGLAADRWLPRRAAATTALAALAGTALALGLFALALSGSAPLGFLHAVFP